MSKVEQMDVAQMEIIQHHAETVTEAVNDAPFTPYIGTKLIGARPNPVRGGYDVRYGNPDGSQYDSWSPKDVFESSYVAAIPENFGKSYNTLVGCWMGAGMDFTVDESETPAPDQRTSESESPQLVEVAPLPMPEQDGPIPPSASVPVEVVGVVPETEVAAKPHRGRKASKEAKA